MKFITKVPTTLPPTVELDLVHKLMQDREYVNIVCKFGAIHETICNGKLSTSQSSLTFDKTEQRTIVIHFEMACALRT